MKSKKTRIVILGGGFGGVYTYKSLHKYLHKNPDGEIIMVSKTNHFLFTPLLHEVATGNQEPTNITEPLRKIVGCCLSEFYMTQAHSVDPQKKILITDAGNIPYDILVLTPGAKTNFFGCEGAEEHCFTLKNLQDALTLKNRCIDIFEEASKTSAEEQKQLLSFSIIGGGPTGVELCAEMAELFYETFATYYPKKLIDNITLRLIQSGKSLVPMFPEYFQSYSRKTLEEKHVHLMLNTKVTSITQESFTLNTGEIIPSHTHIWVAGIQPQSIDFLTPIEKNDRGQIKVNSTLQSHTYPEIFVIGDSAEFQDIHGNILPATAQVATRQAKNVGKNIALYIKKEPLENFHYTHSGDLLSLGKWHALGHVMGKNFSGKFAWWLWRSIYLMKLISFNKKMRVALSWTLDIFSKRDISKI